MKTDIKNSEDYKFIQSLITGKEDKDRLIEKLETSKKNKIQALTDNYQQEKLLLEDKIEKRENKLKDLRNEQYTTDNELSEIEDKINKINNEIRKFEKERNFHIQNLIIKRADYDNQKRQRIVNEYSDLNKSFKDIIDIVNEQEDKIYERAKRKHETELKLYEDNKPEFERRKIYLKSKRDITGEKLSKLETYIEKLQKIGITRTTSGFMTWAGYLSFVAFGWYLGEIIKKIQEGNLSSIKNLFSNLTVSLMIIFTDYDPMVSVTIIGSIFILLVIFSIWFIKKYPDFSDKSSNEEQNNFKTRDREKSKPSILSLFNTNIPNKPDMFKSIAPFFIFILFSVFIFVIIIALSKNTQRSIDIDPWLSVLYTYLGTIVTISIAAFILLYTNKVIEPRHRTYFDNNEEHLLAKFKLNWELYSVLGLFVFVIILYDNISNSFNFGLIGVWGLKSTFIIFLLIILVSFALSYGLIFHGIFKDLQALKSEINLYENEIQRYSLIPTIPYYENELNKKYLSRIEKIQQRIDDFWNNSDLWKSNSNKSYLEYIPLVGSSFKTSKEEYGNKALKINKDDKLYEPEIVEKIICLENEKKDLDNDGSNLESKKEKILKYLNELDGKIISVEVEMEGFRDQLKNNKANFEEHKEKILDEFEEKFEETITLFKLSEYIKHN